jgi:hypothetical protein
MGGFTVAELEASERDAGADFWAAAPEVVRARFGLEHRRLGDAALLLAPGLDGSLMFNRLLGWGSGPRSREADIDDGIAAFGGAGVRTWAVQIAPGLADLAALAATRGLVPHPRAWVRFARGPEAPAAVATTLVVRPVEAREAAAFGATLVRGFGMPEALAPWAAALVGRDGWRCFLAWDGPAPVGTGALRLGDGLGWLGFGATLREARGRGGQGAMLAARIAAGLAAGCRGFVTETGRPLPGEDAPSLRNIERAGFRQVYERPNLWRPS